MSMPHLRPCSGCARHVRANVTTCPFCDAQLSVDTTTPAQPQERLSRAARMAFGGAAAVAMTVAACGEKPKENIAMPYGAPPDRTNVPQTDEAGTNAPPPTNIAQPYGAPPNPNPNPTPLTDASVADAGKDSGADAGKKTPPKATVTAPTPTPTHTNMNKPYGAPPADGYGVFDV